MTRLIDRNGFFVRGASMISILLFAIGWVSVARAQAQGEPVVIDGDGILVVPDLSGPIAPLYVAGDVTRRLSLAESLALAVKKNLDVEVARYEPLIAEQEMESVWGAYDPVFSVNYGRVKTENPVGFSFDRTAKNQTLTSNGGASLSTLLPYIGATLGVEYETGDTKQNSSFQQFSKQYDSSIFLTARIPLLKGLIWSRAWTDVKVREIGYDSSLEGFGRAVMDITEDTVNRYWNLVATYEQFGVARKSLETARALRNQTQTQYEVGVVSRVETVEAEAGVADRDFNLIVARNSFQDAEDALIDAVFGPELSAVTTFRVRAVDDPEDYQLRDVNVSRAVRLALQRLPELRIAEQAIEQRKLELKFAKNSRLPQFDITASYGFLNRSGDENIRACPSAAPPAAPPPHDPACVAALSSTPYRRSHDDFFDDAGFENYEFRGTFSIPIPNTTGRREVNRSQFDLQRARSVRSRTRLDVIVAVRSAARGILASAEGIEAAERRRLAAEEQLRAERIRLEHGESTPFEVLQRESDLVEAESQKINALQSYRRAEVRLERAQGTILDRYRIQLDDVRQPVMR